MNKRVDALLFSLRCVCQPWWRCVFTPLRNSPLYKKTRFKSKERRLWRQRVSPLPVFSLLLMAVSHFLFSSCSHGRPGWWNFITYDWKPMEFWKQNEMERCTQNASVPSRRQQSNLLSVVINKEPPDGTDKMLFHHQGYHLISDNVCGEQLCPTVRTGGLNFWHEKWSITANGNDYRGRPVLNAQPRRARFQAFVLIVALQWLICIVMRFDWGHGKMDGPQRYLFSGSQVLGTKRGSPLLRLTTTLSGFYSGMCPSLNNVELF